MNFVDCEIHGANSPAVMVGTIIQSPFCCLCLKEFRENFERFMADASFTAVVPLVKKYEV